MELSKFVDFDGMLNHLFEEHKEDLIEYRWEDDSYNTLLSFMDEREKYTLEIEDCSFDGKEIEWYYTMSLNNANESNNHSDVVAYYIRFSTILDEFTDCEYQH